MMVNDIIMLALCERISRFTEIDFTAHRSLVYHSETDFMGCRSLR